jgi:streptogramin lyase
MTSPRDDIFAFGSVWVSNGPAATVTRVDPATNAVQAVISVPDPASVLASSDDAMWLTSYPGNSLTRIDPDTNQATGTISLAPSGQGAVGVTAYDGFVWVANHDGTPSTSVAKVDPAALRVVDVIPVGSDTSAGPTWLSGGAGSLWVDVPNSNAIMRIDPATDHVIATIADPTDCGSVAASDTAVWVASPDGDGCTGGVIEIDPATNAVVARLNSGDGTGPLVLSDDGSVWFGTDPSGYLGRIDPSSATVASRVKLPGPAFGVTIGGGSAWVTDRQDNVLFKVPVGQAQP